MFENLIIAFEAVAPMFIMLSVGFFIGHKGMLNGDSIKQINKMLFKVLFPLVVVKSLYGTSLEQAFDIKLIIYSIVSAIVLWTLTIPAVMLIVKENATRGAMIQAINRSNFLVIGFPVVNSICKQGDVAVAALTIVGMLLVNNVFSVIVLEIFRGSKPEIGHVLKEIMLNPIIIATVIGVIMMVGEIRMPQIIEESVGSLAGIATPLALVTMGASIDIRNISERKRNIAICVIGKLIVVPGIVTAIGALLGFRGVAFVTLLAFFTASQTTTSYTMADQMDSDAELARDSLVFSTAIVSVTMFLWIFIYKTIGMF